eukprot:Sdes_comp19113_c0_seq1m9811
MIQSVIFIMIGSLLIVSVSIAFIVFFYKFFSFKKPSKNKEFPPTRENFSNALHSSFRDSVDSTCVFLKQTDFYASVESPTQSTTEQHFLPPVKKPLERESCKRPNSELSSLENQEAEINLPSENEPVSVESEPEIAIDVCPVEDFNSFDLTEAVDLSQSTPLQASKSDKKKSRGRKINHLLYAERKGIHFGKDSFNTLMNDEYFISPVPSEQSTFSEKENYFTPNSSLRFPDLSASSYTDSSDIYFTPQEKTLENRASPDPIPIIPTLCENIHSDLNISAIQKSELQ